MSLIRIATAKGLALLLCASAWSPLAAQSSSATPGKSRTSDAALIEEIPSVFGASRFDQLSTEAPASVTVITAEDIASHAWRNLSDMLQTVRGFYVIDDGVYPTIGTRAFGRPGDYNSKLLLVIDGHRINENMFDSFGPGAESMIDLRDVERIEIVRGPASSLYGTSAFFGVVNVVTTRGRALGGIRARAASESFGTKELTLAAGNRLPRGIDFYVSGAVRRSDGRDIHVPEFDTSASGGWARGLDGERRNHATMRVSAGGLTINGIVNHRSRDFATGRYQVDFGVPGNSVHDNYGMLGAAYDHRVATNGSIRMQASYNAVDYGGSYVYGGVPASDYAHGRWIVGETQYTTALPHGHRVVLGAQVIRTPRQEQGVINDDTQQFYDNTRQASWALFAQDELRLRTHWLVTAGVRMDAFSAFGKTVNPRLALIRTFGAGSALKLLYGSAFRAPNNFERYYFGLGTIANPSLAPERINTAELLLEHRVSSQLKVNAALYRNQATQLIDLVRDSVRAAWQYENAGRVRATGLELEAQFEWRGARTTVTQAFQHGFDAIERVTISNAPRSISTIDLVVPITRTVSGTVEMRALSSRLTADRSTLPAFMVANTTLTARLFRGRAHAVAGIFNVFNRRYSDPASDQFVQSSIRQAGRTFRASLEVGSR